MKLLLFFLKSAPFLICFWFAIPYILGEDKIEVPPKSGEIISDEKVEAPPEEPPKVGEIVTTYRSIPVYSNGEKYTLSYGKNFSSNQYYYGQKWQCVEFVKRFYHDAFKHKMPSVWGHAKGYYDPSVIHGKLNNDRGMYQFKNGGATSPQPDDLLVFDLDPFGHVAVISKVLENEIEVVQQNIAGKPRQTFLLEKKDGLFNIVAKNKPLGWLRLPPETLKNPVFPVESQPTPEITPAP